MSVEGWPRPGSDRRRRRRSVTTGCLQLWAVGFQAEMLRKGQLGETEKWSTPPPIYIGSMKPAGLLLGAQKARKVAHDTGPVGGDDAQRSNRRILQIHKQYCGTTCKVRQGVGPRGKRMWMGARHRQLGSQARRMTMCVSQKRIATARRA